MSKSNLVALAVAAATPLILAGCANLTQTSSDAVVEQPAPSSSNTKRQAAPAATKSSPPVPTTTPTKSPSAQPSQPAASSPSIPPPSNAPAYLSVPKAGISNAKIVTYSGVADDTRGTEINDAGLVGAPRGSWGGVAPGQIGNLLLTGHRTSAGSVMLNVPRLTPGDKIYVDQGKTRFVYVASSKAKINFRSAASRALQQAAVPGSPGKRATRPAVVLSTCATPEDNAAGNYWRDEHQNPTHRIAVYGYLQSVIPRR